MTTPMMKKSYWKLQASKTTLIKWKPKALSQIWRRLYLKLKMIPAFTHLLSFKSGKPFWKHSVCLTGTLTNKARTFF